MRDELGAPYDALTQGAGALNVEGAIRLARMIDPAAPVGTRWLTGGVTPATTIADETTSGQ